VNSPISRAPGNKGGTMAEYAAVILFILFIVVGVFMLLGVGIWDLIASVADVF
jgi:hypothetical protein